MAQRQGRVREAEQHLKAALTKAPTSLPARIAWARYLTIRQQFAEADAAFTQLIADYPDVVAPRLDQGDLYLFRLNKPDAAIDAYCAALALRPEMAGASYALGIAQSLTGRQDEVLASFSQAAREETGVTSCSVHDSEHSFG
ncbi:MAG: hypothetical protein KF693_14165 [Nitrospira sp.]|nr:hypothetical protein [Nitrospira sp.]